MTDHNTLTAKTETRAQYAVQREINATVANEDSIIAAALEILARRMRSSGVLMDSPEVVRDWLRLRVGGKPHEELHGIRFPTHRVYLPKQYPQTFLPRDENRSSR